MNGKLIIIGGGARSGKSAFALHTARTLGRRRAFIATAEALDAEMKARIRRHREERGESFTTFEEPLDLVKAVAEAADFDVALIDCVTLWLSNLLHSGMKGEEVLREVDRTVDALAERKTHVIVVTNEVGLGLVPETPLGRLFRDLAGTANRRLSSEADEVHYSALGVMLRLKPNPIVSEVWEDGTF